jgi:NTE family protein
VNRRNFLADNLRYSMAGLGGAGLSAALAGCTLSPDENHVGADAPQFKPFTRSFRTAWVFSSGGPRGFVHVGVIKALTELGHKPDLLVGASVGAVVAVVYACGKTASEIEQMALDLQAMSLGRLAVGGTERLSGAAISALIYREVNGKALEEMPTPVVCVATRRSDASLVGFNAGDAGLAAQASCAIEGQFTPVRIRGEQFVDPDLHQPLPVRLARQMGAQRVLAIDASAHEDKAPAGATHFRTTDLRKRALTEPDARSADLTLHPEFGYYVNLSREFRQRAIEAGYRATMAAANRLAALHASANL